MTTTTLAAGLLEIEALLMNCRAQALQQNRQRFTDLLLEARAKLNELTVYLVSDGCAPLTELFLAVPKEEPPSADAGARPEGNPPA